MKLPDDLDLAAPPLLIPHQGRLVWQFPSGRLITAVRGGDGPDEDKKFTQSEVEAMITSRLEQFRRNNKPEPPADYADLQAAATELAEMKARSGTDLDRATAEIAKLTRERDKAVSERDSAFGERDKATETSKTVLMRAAIVAAAAKAKAVDPDDVFALLPKDKVTIGDDGQVTGAEDAVKALLEAKPHLVGQAPRPKADPAQGQRSDPKDYGAAGRAEAQKRFGVPAGQQQ